MCTNLSLPQISDPSSKDCCRKEDSLKPTPSVIWHLASTLYYSSSRGRGSREEGGSKNAPPGKRRRRSKGQEVKSRREPTKPGGSRGVCLGPGGPPESERPRKGPRPPPSPGLGRRARARLSPTPHFPSVQAARPAGRAGSGPRWPTTSGDLGFGGNAARRCLRPSASARGPRVPSLPDSPPRLPPAAFTCSGSGWRASRPGPRRRVRDAAPRVRSPFPPPPLRSPARRRAGEQRRPRGGGGGGGDAPQAPGGETLPLSVRPGKSSLAAASRERAGGWPNGEEGSRGVGNGCHVAQVARRPPPPPPSPAPRRDLWFVPELRHGASARPAGPAPGTRPAGAPASHS
ncbi:translation initiation factor IF-2-like [Prionailurus viverrinus]|uniref:translation initiation factor IF-2-like n=1 Tax=Prionailurus viverrinus TaxID=61388 RepID=UPI001FF22AA2|nr:translation initiation factor IF-2-like [Prionailurus viverrinus]